MANSAIQLPGPSTAPGDNLDTYRNRIINGRFDVWQRANFMVPPPIPVVGDLGFSADRWVWVVDTDGGVINPFAGMVLNGGLGGIQQGVFAPGQTDVPGDATDYIQWEAFVNGSLTSSAAMNLVQRIENVETFNGEKATLSFWVKGAGPGTIAITLLQVFGGGGSPPVIIQPTNASITTTWQKHTILFNVPSTAGKTIGTNNSLRLRFHNLVEPALAALKGFPTPISYAGVLEIANVQLEVGEIVDPQFEELPLETVWGLCQRYYQQTYNEGVQAGTPTTFGVHIFEADGVAGDKSVRYPVPMRVVATLAFFDPWAGAPFTADHPIVPGAPTGVFPLTGFTDSNQEFGFEYGPAIDNSEYSFHWIADAEL